MLKPNYLMQLNERLMPKVWVHTIHGNIEIKKFSLLYMEA